MVYKKPLSRLRSVLSIANYCNRTTFRAQVVPNFGDGKIWSLFRFSLFRKSVNRYLKFSKTEHSKNSISILGAKTWNRIPNCLHSQMKIWSSHLLQNLSNCLNCPVNARIISSFDFKHRTSYHTSFICLHSLTKFKFKRILHDPLLNILIQVDNYVGVHSLIDKFRNLESLNLKYLLVILGSARASGLFLRLG